MGADVIWMGVLRVRAVSQSTRHHKEAHINRTIFERQQAHYHRHQLLQRAKQRFDWERTRKIRTTRRDGRGVITKNEKNSWQHSSWAIRSCRRVAVERGPCFILEGIFLPMKNGLVPRASEERLEAVELILIAFYWVVGTNKLVAVVRRQYVWFQR